MPGRAMEFGSTNLVLFNNKKCYFKMTILFAIGYNIQFELGIGPIQHFLIFFLVLWFDGSFLPIKRFNLAPFIVNPKFSYRGLVVRFFNPYPYFTSPYAAETVYLDTFVIVAFK